MSATGSIASPAQSRSDTALRRISVTVAICTCDRPEKLIRAVRSIANQTVQPDELLVVDNGSALDGSLALEDGEPTAARYVREGRAGLDFARNAALRAATSDIVAFLDDDAVADPNWVAELLRVFSASTPVAACTGRTLPLDIATEGARIFEANGGFSGGDEPLVLPADAGRKRLRGRRAPLTAWVISSGTGCNMAVDRRIALDVGGFDEALDLGGYLPGGGDHDMLWRLLEAGHSTAYSPNARIKHEHRAVAAEAYTQIVGHQRALVAFLAKSVWSTAGKRRWEVVVFLAWRLVKPGVRLVKRVGRRDPLPAPVLFRMWRNCWRGLVAYPLARRAARTRNGQSPPRRRHAVAR